jgi:beta-lactam-binding protein with PASTA domain
LRGSRANVWHAFLIVTVTMRWIRLASLCVVVLAAACQQASSGVRFGSAPSATPTPATSLNPNVMPDVRFLPLAQAERILEGLHLHVTHRHMATIDYRPRIVMKQNPEPGAPIMPGQQVGLVISAAPVCDPSYPTVCIQPFQPHISCKDVPYKNFPVVPPDDNGLDGDHDGIGCERVEHPKPTPSSSPSPSPTPSSSPST